MSRWILLLVAVLPLAGCESDADFWAPYDYVVDSARSAAGWDAAPQLSAAPVQQAEDPHCRKVAYARAADARANGFDDDTREAIYSGTYRDCLKWNRTHQPDAAD